MRDTLIKILSAIVITVVVYILCVFLLPTQSDNFSHYVGINGLNTRLREIKAQTENFGSGITFSGSGTADGGGNIFTDGIKWVQNGIKTTSDFIGNKTAQAQKVMDSFNKTKQSAEELQQNVSALTSDSGTQSGSGQ